MAEYLAVFVGLKLVNLSIFSKKPTSLALTQQISSSLSKIPRLFLLEENNLTFIYLTYSVFSVVLVFYEQMDVMYFRLLI